MTVSKLSISLSPELDAALDVLCARTGRAKSALIETALRENPLVAKYVAVVRAEEHAEPSTVPRRRVTARHPRATRRASP
jgi:predicted transcriptional regulator